jgi:hypothetical protein
MQPQPGAGQLGDVAMPGMGRIERAAEQPDAGAAAVAEARNGVQGRTCPSPG